MTEQRVTRHKVVSFTYAIHNEAGELVERVDLPVSYVHGGNHQLISRLEEALDGARAGDTVELSLGPEEGFGARDPSLIFTDDLANVPEQYRRVGAEVEMRSDRGEVRPFVVSSIEDGKLTLDGNHPLAGQTVTFHIQVTDIRDATPEEIQDGVSQAPGALH